MGTARDTHETLAPDGTWMIVEPLADDTLRNNLNLVERVCYAGSTMVFSEKACSRHQPLRSIPSAAPAARRGRSSLCS